MPATRGYLGLGSNLGDRLATLRNAVARLAAVKGLLVKSRSSAYNCPAWGYSSPNDYLNAVIEVEWHGTPSQLQFQAHQVEHDLWRIRKRKLFENAYQDRTIDIDLLWLDGVETQAASLTLPHPLAHRRAFVLVPWNEIAPELQLTGRYLGEWLAQLPKAEVEAMRVFDSL